MRLIVVVAAVFILLPSFDVRGQANDDVPMVDEQLLWFLSDALTNTRGVSYLYEGTYAVETRVTAASQQTAQITSSAGDIEGRVSSARDFDITSLFLGSEFLRYASVDSEEYIYITDLFRQSYGTSLANVRSGCGD